VNIIYGRGKILTWVYDNINKPYRESQTQPRCR